MKTQYEMLVKAVSIADNDSNARIGVFCDFREIKDSWKKWEGSGKYTLQTRTYISSCGGRAHLIATGRVGFDICNYAGAEYTHLFYDEELDEKVKRFLQCRVRTNKDHPEPSGIYNNYGVVSRLETY